MSLFDDDWENELYLWTGWITIQGERGEGREREKGEGGKKREGGEREIYSIGKH